jgi:hypothetical protein
MSSRPAMVSIQPPIQWLSGDLSPGAKRPGREADHSPQTSAKVKNNMDLYIHSPIQGQFNLSSHLGIPRALFAFGFPAKFLYEFASLEAVLHFVHLILIIFGQNYKF